ncbi:hypothetical protein ETD83_35800 [Actinomadura soli]|uniref:Uncharacterized protein n=1 Tax=Actinomadura soli TaxID=2508997 RepID=A0A5C4J1U3_9ACTN|nr:hypothetical protein [Actinomadura soli]TMQ90356.1 hypothetical protein ETD83_35800 [Actinomadura soli]
MSHESATTIARQIAAVPARTSSETWGAIVDLVTEPGSTAHQDLTAITSIAAIVISEEYTREAPIIIMPASGPRIRVRTVHGTDAIEAINEETPLYSGRLTGPGWTVSLPCGPDDLDDLATALAGTPAVVVRDTGEGLNADAPAAAHSTAGGSSATPIIDLSELRRS